MAFLISVIFEFLSLTTVPVTMTGPAEAKAGMSEGAMLLPKVMGMASSPLEMIQRFFFTWSLEMVPMTAAPTDETSASAYCMSLSLSSPLNSPVFPSFP